MKFLKCMFLILLGLQSTASFGATVETRALESGRSHILFDGDLKPKEIALTFGGTTNPEVTNKILDLLKVNQLRAHFFVPGLWAAKYPQLLGRMLSEGHVLGSNGFGKAIAHDETTLDDFNRGIAQEISIGHEEIFKTTGLVYPFIRFSYRHNSFGARQFIRQSSVFAFYWNIDYYESDPAGSISKVLERENYRGLVAMGSGTASTIPALERLIQEIKDNDLKVILFTPPTDMDWQQNPPLIRNELRLRVLRDGNVLQKLNRVQGIFA